MSVLPDSVRYLRIAGVVTGGGDGTGGPDAAPDNLSGMLQDSNAREVIDNYAILDLDADGDHIPDFNVNPKDRIRFFVQPPITGVQLALDTLTVDRPSFAPSRGQKVRFHFSFTPAINQRRTLAITADVHNIRGDLVRTLFTSSRRLSDQLTGPGDYWDGRDDNGNLVPGGIYVLRLNLEPGQSRVLKPVVVAR